MLRFLTSRTEKNMRHTDSPGVPKMSLSVWRAGRSIFSLFPPSWGSNERRTTMVTVLLPTLTDRPDPAVRGSSAPCNPSPFFPCFLRGLIHGIPIVITDAAGGGGSRRRRARPPQQPQQPQQHYQAPENCCRSCSSCHCIINRSYGERSRGRTDGGDGGGDANAGPPPPRRGGSRHRGMPCGAVDDVVGASGWRRDDDDEGEATSSSAPATATAAASSWSSGAS
jgi:hypothetical protein